MSTQLEFIEKIAPLVQKYAPQYGRAVCSPIIAQACLESGYGTSNKVRDPLTGEWRHNYFGLKWRNNRCAISNDFFYEGTWEQKSDGTYVFHQADAFCKFKSLEECVIGYFQWTNISAYKNLQGVTDPRKYLENIKKDKYATSLKYVDTVMAVIEKWNLTKYDSQTSTESEKEVKDVAIKIAVDAGHGSQTAGKRTPDGYREHWINVKTAYYCEQYLIANGIETIRVGWNDTNSLDDVDVPLSTRQKQIKSAKCDYSISLHANAFGSGWNSANGVETLIMNSNSAAGDSLRYAQCIQNQVIKGTQQTNRGVKRQSLAMCNCTLMGVKAAALVEIGFMTNIVEANLMKSETFCKEQGEDVARGILDYLGVVNQTSSTTDTKKETTTDTSTSKFPYLVRINTGCLNVRASSTVNSVVKTTVHINEVYTIVAEENGWGKLKSGAGWINLGYTKRA